MFLMLQRFHAKFVAMIEYLICELPNVLTQVFVFAYRPVKVVQLACKLNSANWGIPHKFPFFVMNLQSLGLLACSYTKCNIPLGNSAPETEHSEVLCHPPKQR